MTKRSYRSNWRTHTHGRHWIKRIVIGARVYVLHATKGWRSFKA